MEFYPFSNSNIKNELSIYTMLEAILFILEETIKGDKGKKKEKNS